MADEKVFFIYCHTAPNGKRYIGQTSLDLEKRWAGGRGYIHCTYFHKAIQKYGWDSFRHDILCVVHSKKLADKFEEHYIAKYDTFNAEHGYNLTKGGGGVVGCTWDEERKKARSKSIRGKNNGMYGRHHTAESRRKMSEKLSGREHSPEVIALRTSYLLKSVEAMQLQVRQIDSNGNLVETHCSIAKAAEVTGTNRTSIVRCVRGDCDSAGGFKWEYVDEGLRKESLERARKRHRSLEKKVLNGQSSGSKGMSVVQYDGDGNELARFKSLSDAERNTGVNRDMISDCCHIGMGFCGGYRWSFADNRQRSAGYTRVRQLGLDGVEIAVFDSPALASQLTGVRVSAIRNCCNGGAKTARGFIWEFADPDSARKSKPYTSVIQFDAEGHEVARYKSVNDAMRATGFDRHRIVECCKGERDVYKNTYWQYAETA